MDYFIAALKKYAVFTGRSRRKEFWMFMLINIVIGIFLGVLDTIIFGMTSSPLSTLFSLALLPPSLGVFVRRMHDINKSGWYALIPIYSLILASNEGDSDTNAYGENPKELTEDNL